jgi:hypothetical protein
MIYRIKSMEKRRRGRPRGSSNKSIALRNRSPGLTNSDKLAALRSATSVRRRTGLHGVRQRRTDAALDAILSTLSPEQRILICQSRGNPQIEAALRGLCASLLAAEDMIDAAR